jgi:small conductance mechanosensitive channel
MNPTPLNVPIILAKPLLPSTEVMFDIGVRLLLTILIAAVAQQLLFLLVGRGERFAQRANLGERAVQRARTLGHISRSLITVIVVGATIVHVLGLFGWDVKPLLAGAGIVGVALGFGAQTLVRDVIAGVFILAEDQFGVGDLIEINGQAATVEALTVRCTTLRDFHGFVHYVPNGEMKIVTNRSRGWNRLAVDVPVAADENVDRALEIVAGVVRVMNEDAAWSQRLLDPIDLWGIETIGPNEVQIRMAVRARPGADAPQAARELRRRIAVALNGAGIRTSVAREISITPISGAEAAPELVHPLPVRRSAGDPS